MQDAPYEILHMIHGISAYNLVQSPFRNAIESDWTPIITDENVGEKIASGWKLFIYITNDETLRISVIKLYITY